MQASQIAITPGSVYAIGPHQEVSFIERGPEGLWGRWQSADVTAKHMAHGGQVVAAIGSDDRVSVLQRAPRRPWECLKLRAAALAAAHLPDGAPALFARTDEGIVWHTWKPTPSSPWSDWQPLAGGIHGLAAERIPGGGLVVFGIRDGVVTHRWQDHPFAPWQEWTDLDAPPAGGEPQSLGVTTITRGGLVLFVLGGDGVLSHRWQGKPFGSWHGWESLGEGIRSFSVTRALAGGLVVFAVGPDDLVQYRFQSTPSGNWNRWIALQGRAKALACQPGYVDGLEVFAVGMTGEVNHKWCDRLDAPWTDWTPLDYEASPLRLSSGPHE